MTIWTSLLALMTSCASIPVPPLNSLVTSPGEVEVPPIELPWKGLTPELFDRRWILPERRKAPGRDLLAEMRSLVDLRFDVELANSRRYRCLGDLVLASQNLALEARKAWYAELEQAAPQLMAERGAALSKLLFDSHLHTPDWKPSKVNKRDGLLFAENWNLKREGAPWNDVGVAPLMEQAAAIMHADLRSIKTIENDYRAYPMNVGADYEAIYPIAGMHFAGKDPAGKPYSSLTIQFRCDLPFPFSDYTTRLRILNQFDADNVLSTHIYSTSKDFYWLAGRDVFLPVTTSEGKWVSFVLVRHFGFDLDGVPDGADNRREALRGSLGNLKRNSEKLFLKQRASLRGPHNGTEVLGQVRVLGQR
ncbi:MAG: hypothetical protein ACI9F9_001427 [Candidatus Paceibacteria bacterium]|jgi:hypothetical protein